MPTPETRTQYEVADIQIKVIYYDPKIQKENADETLNCCFIDLDWG